MRFIFISIIALFAISCSPTKQLQGRLSKYKQPIGYIHDSKSADCTKSDSLIIKLNNKPLDSLTSVSLIYKHTVYLLLYASSDIKMNVKLGQNNIQKQYNDFFVSSLIDESKRSGCYGISNKVSDDLLYTLEITIDSCKTNADYRYEMFDLLGMLSISVNGFPAETNMHVSTKLKKGGIVLAEKAYTIKRKQPFLTSRNISFDRLEADFVANMAESLSLGTKECIEKIINDLNSTINKK
jgi:hypothetical protein